MKWWDGQTYMSSSFFTTHVFNSAASSSLMIMIDCSSAQNSQACDSRSGNQCNNDCVGSQDGVQDSKLHRFWI